MMTPLSARVMGFRDAPLRSLLLFHQRERVRFACRPLREQMKSAITEPSASGLPAIVDLMCVFTSFMKTS